MSHSATTPTTTRTSVTTRDTASVCSLASTLSMTWEDESKEKLDPPAATTPAAPAIEIEGEAGSTKTGSLIIRSLFIAGFFIPLAWIVAVVKVFFLDRGRSSSPLTPTSAGRQTDIEANAPSKEEKYHEGLYWGYLCLIAGTVYIAGVLTIVWILCVEKERSGA